MATADVCRRRRIWLEVPPGWPLAYGQHPRKFGTTAPPCRAPKLPRPASCRISLSQPRSDDPPRPGVLPLQVFHAVSWSILRPRTSALPQPFSAVSVGILGLMIVTFASNDLALTPSSEYKPRVAFAGG